MSIEGIIVGLLALVIGLGWAFYGLKVFTILLPLWAFFFGLLSGAGWAQSVFGDGLFASVLSWGIGIVLGLVLAVISYLWYYAAITIAGGAVGYALGLGFVDWLAPNAQFIAIVAGLIVGAVFAAGTFLLGVPIWLVIWFSAISGAAAAINGILIMLGRIHLEDLHGGLMSGLLKDSFIGVVAWIVVAVAAGLWQTRDVGRSIVSIERANYRY